MIYWIVRDKTTNKVLPARIGKRGVTYEELIEPTRKPPRLFMTYQLAKFSLDCWLQGKWREAGRQDSFGEYDVELIIKKVPERIAENMEIVSVGVTYI